MEYTIDKLAKLAHISSRTLRWYDECGLLKPKRVSSNGYRIYGEDEVNKLQLILFYKELDFELSKIKEIIDNPSFDIISSLENHQKALIEKRDHIDNLILNVEKTIKYKKGERDMSNEEKFESFKKNLVDENEKKYSKELKEKYSKETIKQSNEKVLNMSKEQYEKSVKVNEEFEKALSEAFIDGNPESELAQKACALHKEWLEIFAPYYNKEYHKALGKMYTEDDRFRANYDKFGKGCAEFLRDAINIYCK